jgi:hypothetical protein
MKVLEPKPSARCAVEMPGAVETMESQNRASHRFHEPLGNLAKTARFPHSHSAGDEGGGKVENQKQVSHFSTAPTPSTKTNKRTRGLNAPARVIVVESGRIIVVDREKYLTPDTLHRWKPGIQDRRHPCLFGCGRIT